MDNTKKIIIAGSAFMVLLLTMLIFVLFGSGGSGSSSSNNTLNQGMQTVVEVYYQNIRKKDFTSAYGSIYEASQEYISSEGFEKLYTAVTDHDTVNFAINEKKELKTVKNEENGLEVVYVPVEKTYSVDVNGSEKIVTEDIMTPVVKIKGKYKIYFTKTQYYDMCSQYIFGKALDYIEDSLLYSNDMQKVEKNIVKIETYLEYVNIISSSYEKANIVEFKKSLIEGYKYVIEKDYEEAIECMEEACENTDDVELICEGKLVMVEVYIAKGDYASASKALQEALDNKPGDMELRKDYRRVTGIMLNKLEVNLNSGWAQLSSAIKQKEKEMNRILEDIALDYAEKAIAVKEDNPDAYFLKGNIHYCLGQFSEAEKNLNQAIKLAGEDDVAFKNEVSEILGVVKVGQTNKKVDLASYKNSIKKDLRSTDLIQNGIGGVVDSLQ